MTENHDTEDPVFEDRIRGLLEGDVASRGVSVAAVIAGARRRRTRRRATAAGSSVAVLGVAAGVVAFGLHPAGNATSAVGVTTATSTATSTAKATAPTAPRTMPTTTTESTAAPARTCSPSVTGTVPALTSVTAEGLDFEAVSGTSGGIPWSVQIHAFPTWQSWLDWRKTQPNPPAPSTVSTVVAPPALIRQSSRLEFSMSAVPHRFFGFAGSSIGKEADGSPKAYLVDMWSVPTVDHLCLQFAHHAEFQPVYRIQGGTFAVFGYTAADEPQKVIGYDAGGYVVDTADRISGLLPPGRE